MLTNVDLTIENFKYSQGYINALDFVELQYNALLAQEQKKDEE